MSEWISCDKELPKRNVPVLVATNDIVTEWHEILCMGRHGWTKVDSYDYWPCIVTHWMPLPEMPKD
ncbi:hypothetical protein phiA005_0010 [Aeromonas phage phiA005]|nr:hypothetical protein phiA005_0010 [Aeromonas phage phiA005]